MQLFFSRDQLGHRPTQYGVSGQLVRPLENPNRAETLVESLAKVGLTAEQPGDHGLEPILAVHPEHYLRFLETAYGRFQELPNAGPEVLPNSSPFFSGATVLGARPEPRSQGIIGQTGWYIGDLSCAMTAGTHASVLASAQAAVAAAKAVVDGESAAYALCRPPGHHAYPDRANGFCFLNNAAIAAELLRQRYGRVAIIDFDTHHGDGTQAIFYERGDVFFGSVHTDPTAYYPHYFGYGDEFGAGPGEGRNLNLPLAHASDDEAYVAAVTELAEAVSRFDAEAIVVSAGWDAHRDDPLSRLAVTTAAYPRLGEVLASLGLPTVIVQEGGYSLTAVAEAAPAFVDAFQASHRLPAG